MFDLLGAQRRIFSSSLKPLERLVALAICNFYSHTNPKPFPGVAELSFRTGLDRKAVMRAITGLEVAGALRVDRAHGVSNRYNLAGIMSLPARARNQSPTDTSPSETPVPLGDDTSPSGGTGTSPSGGTLSNQVSNQTKEPITHAPERSEGTAPVVAGSSKTKKAKGSKPKKAPKAKFEPAPSAHKMATDAYFVEFERNRGCKPVFGGVEGKAVTALLEKLDKLGGAEEACKRIRHAFASFRRSSITIVAIAKDPDAFTSLEVPRGVASAQHGPNDTDVIANARRASGQRVPAPRQPNRGYDATAHAEKL